MSDRESRQFPVWAAALLLVACGLGLLWRELRLGREEARLSLDDLPPAPASAPVPEPPRPRPSALARALAELRDTALPLEGRSAPAQKLAFGRNYLGQLTGGELVIRKLPEGNVVQRQRASESAILLTLADGSLLALDSDRLLRASLTTSRVYPRVAVLPGTNVFADRQSAERFWMLHPSTGSLFRYELDQPGAGAVSMGSFFDLPGHDQRVFSVLKDASLLYTTEKGWARTFSANRHTRLKAAAELAGARRAVPARRLDQVWIATDDGSLFLVTLAPALHVVRRISVQGVPFDLDASDERLAVIRLEQPKGRTRNWQLRVMTHAGDVEFSAELPSDSAPGSDDDWVEAVTRNKQVILSRYQPFVAVGGPTWLSVWNVETGERVELP